ncbi:MAG: hypothetical protein BWY73_00432 [candidate division TA06 bacterium ADurb.Bin417]|uniref:UDP-2,3-diacylglucosamine pyrophosphatase LpxI n=1 Tax=candidate division TA06 bacterium ADurb.Bin417 TaxID=1852828 RepID=A0A1V5MJ06_UNCT6|nr:MAG: hypothetical protein BWY73_00432 [candidate division TA06 bacterium ADurb.Bin417]
MKKIGLIAGNGKLPLVFLERARREDYRVYTLALKGEADRRVSSLSTRCLPLPIGNLQRGINFFLGNDVEEAVMIGQVRHHRLLRKERLDPLLADLLAGLPDWRTGTLLQALIRQFVDRGIHFLPSTFLLDELLLPAGCHYGPTLTRREELDLILGRQVAEALALLDVGLTAVVKDGIVLALEAIEGTDRTIRRAGRFTRGAVVVKVSRPNQDMRFDLPVVGPRTIRTLQNSDGRVLGISSGTLVLEKEKVTARAEELGISLVTF